MRSILSKTCRREIGGYCVAAYTDDVFSVEKYHLVGDSTQFGQRRLERRMGAHTFTQIETQTKKTTREQSFGNEKMCWNSDPPCAADNLWLLRLSCWLERGTHSHSYAQIWATNKEETKFKDERLHFGSFTWFAPLPPVQMIAESLVLLVEEQTEDIQDPKIPYVRGSENARFHVVHKEVAKRRKSHLFSAPKTRSILWMYRFVPEHVCAHQNKCATIYFTARTMLILVWARALFPSACAFECDNWNLGKHISFGE